MPFKMLSLLMMAWATALFGANLNLCYIVNPSHHQFNQKLLAKLIDKELAALAGTSSTEQAAYLSTHLPRIAQELLHDGFLVDAYAVPAACSDSFLAFNSFPLWEGGDNGGIPLTFFIYAWPCEEWVNSLAQENNSYYGSNIHSHPIPCSFATLQGALIQYNYALVPDQKRIVFRSGQERFPPGTGEADTLTQSSQPFIHQLVGSEAGSKPCLSLHAYGLPSSQEVLYCFRSTSKSHSYTTSR
jgi:hypothetical protein